jgi:4-diphosphocytidyl-2-C-methyl-D-erythritol kinase
MSNPSLQPPAPGLHFAPAKLNLYLHITGRRADGYHNLDSLVAFAGVGDEVKLEPAAEFSFAVTGPQAGLLNREPPEGNLVVKAAQSLAKLCGKMLDVKITLEKHLPVASGIGGGSSDAAAALRALAHHWELAPGDPRLVTAAAEHGQDVPVCLKIENNYITAEGTIPAPALPRVGVLLVNPNKALPTPAVYKEFREGRYAFSPEARLTATPQDAGSLIAALKARGNDLYAPACKLMPDIAAIVSALENTEGCLLARMSGSGATCFGLYPDEAKAQKAATILRQSHSGWWIEASFLPYLYIDSNGHF